MKRLVFEAKGAVVDKINSVSAEKGIGRADVLRKALELYFTVYDALDKHPERCISVVEGDKILSRYVVI